MSSAFERLQKLAEEKRQKEKSEKLHFEIVPVNTEAGPSVVISPSALSAASSPSALRAASAAYNLPVAPEKDYAKVANSIVRQIPNGVFIGKSKQMYDYLYSLTRGAIKPTRSVRVSKSSLMRGSGIKSTHTFYNNVHHLEAIGLIITTRIDGEKGGNSYEVFVPEEIKIDLEQLAHLAQAGQITQPAQKLPEVVSAETALPALGSKPINIDVSSIPKTSFKDIKESDDEFALASFIETLESVSRKLTNKGLSRTDKERWGDLAELLAMELEIAAARTKSVSNVPAFLTEHLRRRLIGKPTAPKSTSEKSPTDKSHAAWKINLVAETVEEYQAEPLSKQGREAVLKTMQEYLDKGQGEFILSFQNTYTTEDWTWLSNELEKEK